MNTEQIYSGGLVLGESPVWDAREERLYWVDIIGQTVFRSRADGSELQQWETPSMVGALALWKEGVIVLALEDGFHSLELESGKCELLASVSQPSAMRLNDGKVDRAGRFVAGSMQINAKDLVGCFYSLDHDLSVQVIAEGYKITNGPCWNVAGDVFYCNDVAPRAIWAYDYDLATGAVSDKRQFAMLPDGVGGVTDGATVDAEDCVWVAAVFDGKLVRYTPYGSVDRIVEVPVKNVTSLNFGGPNMDVLFLTSLAELPISRDMTGPTRNGGIYAVTGLGVTGIPEPYFAPGRGGCSAQRTAVIC